MTIPAVDLEFTDLSYTAGRRRIIKGISGSFKSGHLTAIMGPSGAGKSTLMNILAGYRTAGVSGVINVNGEPRRLAVFNKSKVYIMQEDLLQPYLTVREAMQLSSRLKLGPEHTEQYKEGVVDEILETLGLTKCQHTFTDNLSGGQRKRVSVALELVDNPPILFLDEPTTGLDVVSINNSVQLLRLLANQGRTVVCTIHQPSASLFSVFDRVYMIAKGKCIYQGVPSQLVPFISNATGLECPQTYNAADYVFEILQSNVIELLCDSIQNGKIIRNGEAAVRTLEYRKNQYEDSSKITKTVDILPMAAFSMNYPNSFWRQFTLLFARMMLQKRRHVLGIWLQIIHHVLSGFLVGIIFQKVGNDASRPFDNFKFCLCVSVFFMYTHCMIPVLTYPFEIKVMKREYFNRWYSLKSFYLAKTLSTLPFIVPLGVVFIVIVYVMSDQPLELRRFAWFATYCLLIALTSEGLGVLIGFTFNCTNGTVVGPSSMAPILMLAMHGMGYGEAIHPAMLQLLKASYLRFGIVGIITALYLDRTMECSDKEEPICFYKDARLIVRDLAMEGEETAPQLIGIIFYLILLRLLAFFSLRYRCTTEFNNTILVYLTKIIKRR
ncbi:ABC-2 type transporter [Nesidiocoris tenuis]|uniref:ABC-2 type transporter n=1 Tax=Nesidiocoris tenuis TaxID=355587 RepID=A0ABN7A5E7_9HEMI|nr:ABC-2 type transporter [Nesidiocoris tenuis]